MPLARKHGRVFAKLSVPKYTFYTFEQLKRLHEQLVNPSAAPLYKLLRNAGREEVMLEKVRTLQDLADR